MAKKGGLGKGLTALVGQTMEEVGSDAAAQTVVELDLAKVARNPAQPRTKFDEQDLEDLAASIKNVGVLQPIIVRTMGDKYEIVAGERRYQASLRAGLKTIPAIIRTIDDTESLELALIENIQRSDLNGIEEARAYKDLLERTSMTQEQLAERLSKSRSAVTNALRLLDLPEEVQDMVLAGQLTAGHARAILGASDDEKRVMLAHKVVEGKLSVRQTEQLAALFSVEQGEKSPRPKLPSSFKKVARQLRRDLSTGVKIKQVQGKYKIEIEFADEDDLERLMGIMRAN